MTTNKMHNWQKIKIWNITTTQHEEQHEWMSTHNAERKKQVAEECIQHGSIRYIKLCIQIVRKESDKQNI